MKDQQRNLTTEDRAREIQKRYATSHFVQGTVCEAIRAAESDVLEQAAKVVRHFGTIEGITLGSNFDHLTPDQQAPIERMVAKVATEIVKTTLDVKATEILALKKERDWE